MARVPTRGGAVHRVRRQALLEIAIQAARAAARALLAQRPFASRLRRKLEKDVKIEADFLADGLIRDRLRAASSFPICSEEDQTHCGAAQRSSYWWIVDPLAGSLNFFRGIPWSCVSIALWHGMEPVLGVIHDVHRHETFSGLAGHGAWLDGSPIEVSRVRAQDRAVLCTGFPARTDYDASSLLAFVHSVQAYQKVRLLGSAALSLAYVACGRTDVYEERHIALWDVAAGLAIVKAAGGAIAFRMTDKDQTLIVRAANRFLLSQRAFL